MLEDDGDPQGRSVLIGIRNDNDIPMIRMVRLSELAPLPEPIVALLAQLEADLPQRKLAMQEQLQQAQREQTTKSGKKRKSKSVPTSKPPELVATAGVTQHVEPQETAVKAAYSVDIQRQPSAAATSKRKAKEEETGNL